MSFEGELANFVHRNAERKDRAHDLWTWLPSCKAAESCLGDHYSNVTPDMAYIMEEATAYISDLKKGDIDTSREVYGCPCQGDCPKNMEQFSDFIIYN